MSVLFNVVLTVLVWTVVILLLRQPPPARWSQVRNLIPTRRGVPERDGPGGTGSSSRSRLSH